MDVIFGSLSPVPSAPRDVQVSTAGSSLAIVSWFPPSPTNGLLTSYSLRVLQDPSGVEVFSRLIPLSPEQQGDLQTVSVPGLDLDNIGYRVLVSATTRVGQGPDSTPILIGAEVTTDTTSATPTPTDEATTEAATIAETDSAPETTEATTERPTNPLPTPSTSEAPPTTLLATPMATPTLSATTEVTRDEVYYVIRVVPPVVGALLLGLCLLACLLCCLQRRRHRRSKEGVYKFRAAESDYQ